MIHVGGRPQISFRGLSQLAEHGANAELCRNILFRTGSLENYAVARRLSVALPNAYFKSLGLPNLEDAS